MYACVHMQANTHAYTLNELGTYFIKVSFMEITQAVHLEITLKIIFIIFTSSFCFLDKDMIYLPGYLRYLSAIILAN